MEGSSNQACGSSTKASLTNLPFRGLFTSTVLSPNPGSIRVYVCEHETAPPEGQVIHTDQKNILIRSLTLRKQKGESSSKNGKAVTSGEGSRKAVTSGEGSRKRASERLLDSETSAKRPQTSSRQEGLSSNLLDKDLQCLTVERLRALLKERGLPVRGKKDELIARLKSGTG